MVLLARGSLRNKQTGANVMEKCVALLLYPVSIEKKSMTYIVNDAIGHNLFRFGIDPIFCTST